MCRLDLHEDGKEKFVWVDEFKDGEIEAKWLPIVNVCTNKGFSPTTLYSDMCFAQNLAKEVHWRKIEDNLFMVQFGCLGD